ncbi:MAG: amino acid deaminase/aldolase [Bacteroidetes bacterium]|nr:amino acid deaminase/aldolase [Bacteroidota bacterium]
MPQQALPPDYLRYRDALQHERLPLAWLDLERFRNNARSLLARSGELPVRLATKSLRCREALAYAMAMDQRFQGLLCYHAAEAAWLSAQGFDDLVVAYPTLVRQDLEAVAERSAAGARIALMVDHPDQLHAAEHAAARFGAKQPVWLDLDCSVVFPGLWFGVYRSPLRERQDLERMARALESCPHLYLEGLMGYEAQIAGVGDAVPGKTLMNAVIRGLKGRSLARIADRRGAAVEQLKALGFGPLRVNGGGTGSLESTQREPWITEVAAGSGLFGPLLFDAYQHFKPEPAAGFALELCRIPGPGMATCLGGGYIASGATGPEKQPRPYLPQGLSLVPQEMAGEVQTPLRGVTEALRPGDPVFFRHAKAGELSEHFLEFIVVSGQSIAERWPTYRGEAKCFLG